MPNKKIRHIKYFLLYDLNHSLFQMLICSPGNKVTVSEDQAETDEIIISYKRDPPKPIMGEETNIALSKTYLFRRYQKEAVPTTNANTFLT